MPVTIDAELVQFLQANPNALFGQIREGTGIDRGRIKRMLDAGMKRGQFIRHGPLRNYRYTIADPSTPKASLEAVRRPGHAVDVRGVVMRYLTEHGRATADEIAETTGQIEASVRGVLTRERQRGTIRRNKSQPYLWWLVETPAPQPPHQIPSELDAAIAALEVRRDSLQDTINILKSMRKPQWH